MKDLGEFLLGAVVVGSFAIGFCYLCGGTHGDDSYIAGLVAVTGLDLKRVIRQATSK